MRLLRRAAGVVPVVDLAVRRLLPLGRSKQQPPLFCHATFC